MSKNCRVVIVCNPAKPDARATMASLVSQVERRAHVQGTGVMSDAASLGRAGADRLVVLGGDGSILSVARDLADHQIPVVGVNFGKLGFLAEFSLDEFIRNLDAVLCDGSLISRRMMIKASVARDSDSVEHLVAVNDCVVLAGPPFRVIELGISVDGEHLTNVRGDGIVLATPSGSTAYNMSVGGPIIQADVHAIAMAPISPHSLSHRPLVVSGDSSIEITANHVNSGTTVVIDGQVSLPFQAGDRLSVRRFAHDFQLVRNPAQHSWHTLTQKLKWGQ